jgi:cytochrome c peroxidase
VTVLVAVIATSTVFAGWLASNASTAPRPIWNWALPKGFPEPSVPSSNPMSRGKVEIGHRLFYDRRLSGNLTQSCASCHRPELGFTDGLETSVGSTGEELPRNSLPLANVAYHRTLTWANPALVTLEKQMEIPLFGTNPVELGINDRNKGEVLQRIKRDRWYSSRFPRVFPRAKKSINWTNIISSIASFQRSIVVGTSKYDRFVRGEAMLSSSERRGFDLFMGEDAGAGCHHCHGTFIFSNQTVFEGSLSARAKFHNTGLYNLGGTGAYPVPNTGVFELTGAAKDMGAFRAPSLRNVARTAPYMHDGSVASLREVIDIYAAGGRVITEGPNAGDGRLNPHKSRLISGINLTEQDREDLLAFLLTLTEKDFSLDPRFSDPFD